jgi:CBS domain-containing protein
VNRISQIMSRNVVTVGPTASCRDAVTLMTRDKIRHLPVVGSDGVLRGIVTDRDLRHHLFKPDVFRSVGTVPVDRLLSEVQVGQIMSTPVVSVAPDTPLDEAAQVMQEHKLGSLPVVDRNRIVGIVTETDLLRRIIGTNSCCPDLEAIVVSYP